MQFNQYATAFLMIILTTVLASCAAVVPNDSAPKNVKIDISTIPDAAPVSEPISRYGNPKEYEVFGKTYQTLSSSQGFVQRGLASWYGTKFDGKRTSSGET